MPYKELAVCLPDSILDFSLENSGEYAFYSIAEDYTGNREANKETPDFIINSNTAPADLQLSNTLFTDDIPLSGFIGEFSTVDAEGDQQFVYELAEGEGAIHNDLFIISGSQLLTGNSFKCYNADVFRIRVKTTDVGGLSLEKAFTLNVYHVFESVEPASISAVICEGESYAFFDQTYSQTGTYTHIKPNTHTCDSVYTLDLRVNPLPAKPIVTLDDKTLSSSAVAGNQWYDLDGKIEGAVFQVYTPEKEGTYYVIITSGNCISEKSDNVNVYFGNNISTISLQGIYLYPNPAKGMITIHIPESNIRQIFIRDLTGRLVIVEDITSGIENVQIDISSLHSESHYIVEAGSIRIKLIVQ
jgi:hypothetical protein